MIIREVDESPFSAKEDYLLVPYPVGTTELPTGNSFAAQVLDRFPVGRSQLERALGNGALSLGQVVKARSLEHDPFNSNYILAFAAIHLQQPEGWKVAPSALSLALEDLQSRGGYSPEPPSVATAGIPGTGYSGIRGDADPWAMREALERSDRLITIYRRSEIFDNEPRVVVRPIDSDAVEIEIPKESRAIGA